MISSRSWAKLTKKLHNLNCDDITIESSFCRFSGYGVCIQLDRDGKFTSSKVSGIFETTAHDFYMLVAEFVDLLKYQDQLH